MTDTAQPAVQTATGGKGGPSGEPSTAFITTLVVLLVALLATAGLLLSHNRSVTRVDAARPAVLMAARTVALDVSTIGAENSPQHLRSLAQESTGAFHEKITDYSAMFAQILDRGKVASQGEVTAVGIESMNKDTASTLVAVSAMVSNAQQPEGQLMQIRLHIQFQRAGAQWLASEVDNVT